MTAGQRTALRFDGVSVVKGRRRLVSDVSFDVRAGAVHALLGHNGAGKTTLMRAVAGQVPVRRGRVEGADGAAVLFVGARFPRDLTVSRIVEHRVRLLGGRVDRWALEALGVGAFGGHRAGTLSTGMAQRLAIGLAMLSGASVLVLDEPTTGLDPQGVEGLRDVVLRLRDRGTTVVLCSHDLAELELVCDEVTCLRRGRLSVSGTVDEVCAGVPRTGHVLRTEDDARAVAHLDAHGVRCERTARGVRTPADVPVTRVLEVLAGAVPVREVGVDRALFTRVYDRYASAPDPLTGRRAGR